MPVASLSSHHVESWHATLMTAALPGGRSTHEDAERVDLLRACEQLKHAHASPAADSPTTSASRDQGRCRTPWSDAPARHSDHILDAAHRGPTTADNLQGLCAACNHTKQAPGWRHRVRPGPGPHTVDLTTPTGHRHHSRAPRPPQPAAPIRTHLARELDRILDRLADARSSAHVS